MYVMVKIDTIVFEIVGGGGAFKRQMQLIHELIVKTTNTRVITLPYTSPERTFYVSRDTITCVFCSHFFSSSISSQLSIYNSSSCLLISKNASSLCYLVFDGCMHLYCNRDYKVVLVQSCAVHGSRNQATLTHCEVRTKQF